MSDSAAFGTPAQDAYIRDLARKKGVPLDELTARYASDRQAEVGHSVADADKLIRWLKSIGAEAVDPNDLIGFDV